MNILVIGSGGREHAIIRKLKESPKTEKLWCAPGNGGIAADAECVAINAMDIDGVVDFAKKNAVDLVFVAPDDPLAAGMVDALEKEGIRAFGPRANAAIIESSKVFSKNLMKKYGIPTADYAVFSDPKEVVEYVEKRGKFPVVIKADGLALGKGVIIAVNKWDAVEKDDKTIYKHTNRIREVLAYMPYAELVFISAKTGQRLPKLFETIDAVIENQTLRIQTGVLNEILAEAVAMQQPPSDRGKRLKIFYMTQVGVRPPTFVIFVNDKELMHFSYTRYIENKVRDAFGFHGTPLKFIIRERGEKS